MKTRTAIACRTCEATPADRGDSISPNAIEYTCSTCLCTGGMATTRQTPIRTTSTSKCHLRTCLGHTDERTAEVICTRCRRTYWTPIRPASLPDPQDFTCRRCQVVLAGGNAVDPLVTVTPERLERLQAARARIWQGKQAHKTPEPGTDLSRPLEAN